MPPSTISARRSARLIEFEAALTIFAYLRALGLAPQWARPFCSFMICHERIANRSDPDLKSPPRPQRSAIAPTKRAYALRAFGPVGGLPVPFVLSGTTAGITRTPFAAAPPITASSELQL